MASHDADLLAEVARRFAVDGEPLACDRHADAVLRYAQSIEADRDSEDDVLLEVIDALQCPKCMAIVNADLDLVEVSEAEEERVLEAFLASHKAEAATSRTPSQQFARISRPEQTPEAPQPRRYSLIAFAAAAVVAIAIGSTMFFRQWHTPSPPQASSTIEPTVPSAETPPAAATPSRRLRMAVRPAQANSRALNTIAITLTAGLSRSLALQPIPLDATNDLLELALVVPAGTTAARFDVTVEDARAKVLRTIESLPQSTRNGKNVVVMTLPAAVFGSGGGYVARLNGISPDGQATALGDYSLSLTVTETTPATTAGLTIKNDTDESITIELNGRSRSAGPGTTTLNVPAGRLIIMISSACGSSQEPLILEAGTTNAIDVSCER